MADSAAGLQILVTSVGSNAVQVAEIRKLLDLFENKQVTFECVDGSIQAELRNKLWGKSGRRTYPQVFLHGEYWGDLDKIQVRCSVPARVRPRRARVHGVWLTDVPRCSPACNPPSAAARG